MTSLAFVVANINLVFLSSTFSIWRLDLSGHRGGCSAAAYFCPLAVWALVSATWMDTPRLTCSSESVEFLRVIAPVFFLLYFDLHCPWSIHQSSFGRSCLRWFF
ncbi:hypothetical protein BDV11DRAFT_58831 [Aspergillus similis]